MQVTWLASVGLPTTVPHALDQTDVLPADGTSLETQTSPHVLKTTTVHRPLKEIEKKKEKTGQQMISSIHFLVLSTIRF